MNAYTKPNPLTPSQEDMNHAKDVAEMLARLLVRQEGQKQGFWQLLPEEARPTKIELAKNAMGAPRAEIKFTFPDKDGAAIFTQGLSEVCAVSRDSCASHIACHQMGAKRIMLGSLPNQYGNSTVSGDIPLLQRLAESIEGKGEKQADIVGAFMRGLSDGEQKSASPQR